MFTNSYHLWSIIIYIYIFFYKDVERYHTQDDKIAGLCNSSSKYFGSVTLQDGQNFESVQTHKRGEILIPAS